MFKIAGRVLDFYDDPDFVNNMRAQRLFGAVLPPLERVHEIPDGGFAIKIATANGPVRKWPIFNKVATMLSGRYFCAVQQDLPDELRTAAAFNLKEAHLKFGAALPPGLDVPMFQQNTREVSIVPPADQIPAPSPAFLAKMAETEYLERVGKMNPEERFEVANKIFNLFKLAGREDLDQRVWDYVEKERVGPFLKRAVADRAAILTGSSDYRHAELFKQLMGGLGVAEPIKVAHALHQFDKIAELDARYDAGLTDPFFAVFGGMTMTKTGSVESDIRKWKFATLCIEGRALGKIFDPLFVSQFQNDPEGTYAKAGPVEKKILNGLLAKIPAPAQSHLSMKAMQPKESDVPLERAVQEFKKKLTGGTEPESGARIV